MNVACPHLLGRSGLAELSGTTRLAHTGWTHGADSMQASGAAVLVRGFVNLVLSQITVRLINFGLNLVTARLLSPEAYGLASVQFHLLNTGIVFLSREGLKRACQRIQQDETVHTPKVLALASLCIPLGAWYCGGNARQGMAAFLELCCGPLYILAKVQLADGVVAVAEAAAIIAKGSLTLYLLKRASLPVAIALSWAQVAYAGVTTLVFIVYYLPEFYNWVRSPTSMPPAPFCPSKKAELEPQPTADTAADAELRRRRLTGTAGAVGASDSGKHVLPGISSAALAEEYLIDSRSLAMCWRFLLQAGVHLLQTEGSRMVMALCQSSYNQGVYGLVTNLGSLVVRTIFFPVEEAAFRAFSKPSSKGSEGEREQIIGVLVRLFGLVGLLAVSFGPSYTYVLLRLVYGQKWSDTEAPRALAYYCGYITLLALNGCTEAYVNAVADPRQLGQSIRWQTAFSAAQILLSFALVWRLGTIGLILADSANMLLRIVYSWRFIKSRASGLQLRDWAPSLRSCAVCAVAAGTLRVTKALLIDTHIRDGTAKVAFFRDACMHVGYGAAVLMGVVFVMLSSESDLEHQTRQLILHSRPHHA
ncbi:hypothetical protein ABBQ32_007366 [Trebouxia sp. C0010 RCD-2024]